MAQRTVRRRFEFEALERRETPSAGLAGSALPDVAKHPKTVALHGSGTTVYSSDTSATFRGQSSLLGAVTGTVTATSTTSSSVVLTGSEGQLDLSVHGSYTKGKTPHFKGTFTIDGGTGAYVGFTGKGNVSGTLNTSTSTLQITMSGKVTE